MTGIEVQVTDDGPATFEVVFADRRGEPCELPAAELREYARELEELAFGLVHSEEARPLPAGAIRVRVSTDEWGLTPALDEVAACVARRILL
jgi:hypothetical protein